MIRPAHRALVERARERLKLDADAFAEALRRWGGVDHVEALTDAGYRRLIDHFTVCGFRDRRRPVLSAGTLALVDELRLEGGWTDAQFTTACRASGIGDLREADGIDLLYFMVNNERSGFPYGAFNERRRDISSSQLRLVQFARGQVQMTNDRYYAMLQVLGAVNSASDLDQRGFALMMAALERDGFERAPIAADKPGFGRRPGFASPEQVELIRSLWREWSGSDVEAELNAWLDRYHRVSSLRFLTVAGAGKVITALKAMKARKPDPSAQVERPAGE